MNILLRSFYNWYRQTLRNPRYGWLLIAGSLIYLFSPLDISPDVVPFLGQIDDLALITMLASEVLSLVSEYFSQPQPSVVSTEEEENGEIIDVEATSIE